MINWLFKKFKREYQTLNRIEISKKNLIGNYKHLSSLQKGVKIAPVLKSNAYGHGILEIARILDPLNPPFFCVDSLYEAYELYKAKIKTKVLIIGYTDPENFKVKKLPFTYAVFDLELAKVLDKYQPGCSVHIFVDTGMHREGIPINELPEFLEQIKKLKNIKVEGLMSHLASANSSSNPLNKLQIKNFKKALGISKKFDIYPKWIHLSNSDGLSFNLKGCKLNLARVGLSLYGISNDLNLKQVLSFKSYVVQVKNLNKGDRVGYSGTFTSRKPMTIGVLPVGYFDGVDRRLSNKYPFLGKVSMNITTIDLSKIKNPHIGMEVNIYPNLKKSAKICKTIPYDILVHLVASTKRIII